MTVLLWDIDGTLLATGGAGMFAWNDAVKELTGRDFDLKAQIRSAGLTDYQIAAKTFEVLALDWTPGLLDRLVSRYEDLLPASLPRIKGRVLPNVREILEQLRRERPDVRSYLLTGNTRGGARAKLTYYGLMEFFPDGAFCVDTSARASIAQRALALARAGGHVDETAVLVVGDTPHDVECANAIGVRTIAVATGGYSVDELRSHAPWRVLETLPPPPEFLQLLDDAGRANRPAPYDSPEGVTS